MTKKFIKKFFLKKLQFIQKTRRNELVSFLTNCDLISEYHRDVSVNIDGQSQIAKLHAITLRDESDQDSLPLEFAYIFIELPRRGYIEYFSHCSDPCDIGESGFKYATTIVLVEGNTESDIRIYVKKPSLGLREICISEPSDLEETFDDVESIDVRKMKR